MSGGLTTEEEARVGVGARGGGCRAVLSFAISDKTFQLESTPWFHAKLTWYLHYTTKFYNNKKDENSH